MGLAFACLYSLVVVGIYLSRGNAPFERHGVTLGTVVLAYFAGGLGAGALVGLLAPLRRRRLGATLLAILAAWLVCFGVGIAMYGAPTAWSAAAWAAVTVSGVVFGTIVGGQLYEPPFGRRR